jgi:hypothetical protein
MVIYHRIISLHWAQVYSLYLSIKKQTMKQWQGLGIKTRDRTIQCMLGQRILLLKVVKTASYGTDYLV